MKDFNGNELNIGDSVIVPLCSSSYTCFLQEGWVYRFTKQGAYEVAGVVFYKGDLNKPWKDIPYWLKRGFSSGKILKTN